MSWLCVKTTDVLDGIKTGKKDVNQASVQGKYPFFSCARETSLYSNEPFLDKNAIIIAGNGAYTGYVKKIQGPFDLYQRAYALYDFKKEVDWRYIYFVFKFFFENRYMGGTSGAAIPYITKPIIENFSFNIPCDKAIQKKIADILWAYDDLIGNNQRRIAILEESAHLLYREWFVTLRFPQSGNEDSANDLPKGWQEMRVSEVIQRVPAGKTYSQKSVISAGKIPVLGQSNNGVIGYHNNEPSVKVSAGEPVIVFANHTCNQRFMFESFSGIKNILPFKPKFPERHDIYWLHHATCVLVKMNAYKGHWPELMAKTLIVPTSKLTFDFGNQVKPIHLQIFNLMKQNEKLAKARDLLLPRLLDGRIKL